MDYLVIIEKGNDGQCSAYVPDLPGCIAIADSVEQAWELIREAIDAHLKEMRERGQPIPPPTSVGGTVHTDAA